MTTATEVLKELIKKFLSYMLSEKGSSPNTIAAYKPDLDKLTRFIWDQRKRASWSEVTKEDIELFVSDLEERTYSGATISRCLAAVRSFFKFAHSEGFLKGNPSESLTIPGFSKPLPKTPSKENVVLLLEQPAKQSTPAALRDAAMMELAYATGVRVTELVSLNLDSVSVVSGNPSVTIVGKGKRRRTVPIHQRSASTIDTYLLDSRPNLLKNKKERALFLNNHGNRMTRQNFWEHLKQYAKDAKVGWISPSILRHSCAVHMLKGGATLEEVQQMLGHAQISTTQKYEHLIAEQTQDSYEKAHPRVGL